MSHIQYNRPIIGFNSCIPTLLAISVNYTVFNCNIYIFF